MNRIVSSALVILSCVGGMCVAWEAAEGFISAFGSVGALGAFCVQILNMFWSS